MSETIGDRLLDLADGLMSPFASSRQAARNALPDEITKVAACEAIARAALAHHKAAKRSHRWQNLYQLSARNMRPDRPGRHIRIGAKLIEAMNVADNRRNAERVACEQWGGSL